MKDTMKRTICTVTFILTLMGVLCFGASAEEVHVEGYYSYTVADGKATITEYSGAEAEIIVPSALGGYPVSKIGRSAFYQNSTVESITVPDGVESIGSGAFMLCENLSHISLPDSIYEIDNSIVRNTAYYDNEDNWYNDVLYIGNHLIEAKHEISGVCNIREGTKTIACQAFYCCTSLENVTIPDSVTSIGIYAFYDACDDLTVGGVKYIDGCLISAAISQDAGTYTDTYVVKEGTRIIADYAFGWVSNFPNIVFPSDVTHIGRQAFLYTSRLNDVYYCGTASEWEQITIGKENDYLLNANIHYNYESHKHTYTSSVKKAATCTADGMKTFTCSCGDSYTETIKATGHKAVADKAVSATCTKTGLTEGSHCSVCKEIIKKQEVTAKKAHTNTTSTTKATLKKNGKTESKCTVCGYVSKTTAIDKIKSVKFSATEYIYNGKTKTPSVIVKDSKGNTLKTGTDYTVAYPKKRKNIGKYTVTVTFKGNYSGTKKLTFEIIPAKVTLSKVSAGKKQLTATWKTISGITGYEVAYSTSKKFTKKTTKTVTIKKAKTKKTTIKKLTKGKNYYVKVRAYKTVDGKKIYGAYSAVKNVKVK